MQRWSLLAVAPAWRRAGGVDRLAVAARAAHWADGAGGPDTSERTSGSITVSAADGLQSVTVGGTTLTPAQVSRLLNLKVFSLTSPLTVMRCGALASMLTMTVDAGMFCARPCSV